MRLKCWMISWAMLLVATVGMAENKEVSLATLNWAPYVGKKLENHGFTAEIVSEAFKRAGYQVEIKFMPWKRVLSQVKLGKFDAGFPAYYSEERAKLYAVSDSFIDGPLVFYKRKDKSISYKTLEDLKPYKIGIVRGYVNTPEFDSADFLQKKLANSDEANLKKLFKEKIDLTIIDQFTAAHILNTSFSQGKGALDFIAPPLQLKTLHVIFSKESKEYEARVAAFNQGLKAIIQDGTLKMIVERHNL